MFDKISKSNEKLQMGMVKILVTSAIIALLYQTVTV